MFEPKLMNNSRGQVLGEYAIVLALVVAALTVMQVYVQRAFQGRYKDAVHKTMGDLGAPAQYEPYYQETEFVTTRDSKIKQGYDCGRSIKEIPYEITARTGTRKEHPFTEDSEN